MARMNLTTFKDNSTTKRIMYGHNHFHMKNTTQLYKQRESFWVIKFMEKEWVTG